MTSEFLPRIKRPKPDPFSAGQRSYQKGEPFDPEFGLRFTGWGIITAQCLYEAGRLSAAWVNVDAQEEIDQKHSHRRPRVRAGNQFVRIDPD